MAVGRKKGAITAPGKVLFLTDPDSSDDFLIQHKITRSGAQEFTHRKSGAKYYRYTSWYITTYHDGAQVDRKKVNTKAVKAFLLEMKSNYNISFFDGVLVRK